MHRSVHSTARNTQRARARHKADRPDTPHPGPAGPRLALRALKLQHDPRLINGAILSAPPKCHVAGQIKATPKLEYVAAPLPPDGLRKPITRDSVSHKVSGAGLPSTTPRSKFTGPNSEPRNPFDFSTPRLSDPRCFFVVLALDAPAKEATPQLALQLIFPAPSLQPYLDHAYPGPVKG